MALPSSDPSPFEPLNARPSETPWMAWAIAGVVVLVLAGGGLLLTHRKPAPSGHEPQPPAQYAEKLTFSNLVMSESTSLSGGKSTFVDGHVHNGGDRTVNAATVQVTFPADGGSPQIETVPLMLVRTRDPYVDIEPVAASPIAPGADREFRLIFESLDEGWNQQLPLIRLTYASTQ